MFNATKIHELAADATPGPWDTDPTGPGIWTLGETVMGGTIAEVNFDQVTGDHRPEGDASLIAFFNPVFAEALASLLDDLLDLAESPITLSGQTRVKEILQARGVHRGAPRQPPPAEEPHPSAVTIDWGDVVVAVEPETFWNGLPTPARRGTAIVAESFKFLDYWARGLIGARIDVVEVILDDVSYGGGTTYLDNRDGSAWAKVTEGRGSPGRGHRDVAIRAGSFEVEEPPCD